MQNVLLRVTHYERGAERIVSARPVILYITIGVKRQKAPNEHSSGSALLERQDAQSWGRLLPHHLDGGEGVLPARRSRAGRVKCRGGNLERRVPQHEDGWIPPRGMCFLHTHARPVLLDDSILCGILPVVPCVRAGCHERAQVGEGPPETEGERRAHLHVHLDAQSVYGDHGRPHGRSTRGWFHAW